MNNQKAESDNDTYSCNYINDLYDALFYKDNDTFEPSGLGCSGLLTTSQTKVRFTVITDKRLDNIKTVTIPSLICEIRHSDGGYIASNVELSTLGTLSVSKSSNNSLAVVLSLSVKSTFTNNCPVSVHIASGTFKFNTQEVE